MIKDVNLKPFDSSCELPTYVYGKGVSRYALIATVAGGYKVMLARLSKGISLSGQNELSHALFESYTDHGEKMSEAKFRVGGCDSEFWAVKKAMAKTGIIFNSTTPCHFLDLLNALGAFYQAANPDIEEYAVVSKMCH